MGSSPMDEEEIAKQVAKQLGVPYACFDNKILAMRKGEHLETLIPLQFAQENLVMPLFLDGETLAVAMANPADKVLADKIKLITGQELQPFISSRTQLLAAIKRHYR